MGAGQWLEGTPHARTDDNSFSDKYHRLTKLDSGSYGSVYECLEVKPGPDGQGLVNRKAMDDMAKRADDMGVWMKDPRCHTVVKLMSKKRMPQNEFMMELEVLTALRGEPFCLQLVEAFETEEEVQVVLKKVGGGNFRSSNWQALVTSEQKEDTQQKIDRGVRYIHQMLTAMSTLHKAGYTHNDGHAGNWMLSGLAEDDATEAMLIDFGKCTKVSVTYAAQQAKGNPGEFAKKDYGFLHDVIWAMNGHLTAGMVRKAGLGGKLPSMNNTKIKELQKMLLQKDKFLDQIIQECVNGSAANLFPRVAPADQAQYDSARNGGGFQAGYSGDERDAYGSVVVGEGVGGDEDYMAYLRRQRRELEREGRRLRAQLREVQRLVGEAGYVLRGKR